MTSELEKGIAFMKDYKEGAIVSEAQPTPHLRWNAHVLEQRWDTPVWVGNVFNDIKSEWRPIPTAAEIEEAPTVEAEQRAWLESQKEAFKDF